MSSQDSSIDVTAEIVDALGRCLSDDSSTFACGGAIPVEKGEGSHTPTNDETETPVSDGSAPSSKRQKREGASEGSEKKGETEITTLPITIRWDSATSIEKLTLPLEDTVEEAPRLSKLIEDTKPASFGYKGKDIIDEAYRKATKLDPTAFSTTFCPYYAGIVDTIAQALLPNARLLQKHHGVKAELYKMNVYAAPSGRFKPHVDTPRSCTQFGSLVVCLPSPHEGGQLVVRHRGRSMTFDWSGPSDSIQWAAFYSDCEHEVVEVTSGQRITLTYNLYVSRGLGDLAGDCPTMDVQKLPLYQEVKGALANPGFMEKGGLLGTYCSHAYAHSTPEGARALPAILKGSDMAVYEVFRALPGVQAFVRPVLERLGDQEEFLEDHDGSDHDYLTGDHVGRSLGVVQLTETGGDEAQSLEDVYDDYDCDYTVINWLNDPKSNASNLGMVHLAYGNQATVEAKYSYCALLFKIPPYAERIKG
ncbi:MAG: hypothetical protein M1837_004913 [Sclerophora amabilis]|nr:MAG: hypothetical protein M1837_004913 [Sclerophora amabilis]